MMRHLSLVAVCLGLLAAPAPASAEFHWPFISAPDSDVTGRWWRQGDLSNPHQIQGGYRPTDDLWHNPANEHSDWILDQEIEGWRTNFKRGRYVRDADGGPQRVIRPQAPRQVELPRLERPGIIYIDSRSRHLFYILSPWRAYVYPISIGRWAYNWRGKIRITAIESWPELDLSGEGRKGQAWLPQKMLGGMDNPLGAKAMYLGDTGCMIHGTNNPKSIRKKVTGGCFRMKNEHVVHLAELVELGTPVHVVSRYPGKSRGSASR